MENWISTKNSLPETRQTVLFLISPHYGGYATHLGKFVSHYENENIVTNHVFIGNYGSIWNKEQISHWMPLPETPELL